MRLAAVGRWQCGAKARPTRLAIRLWNNARAWPTGDQHRPGQPIHQRRLHRRADCRRRGCASPWTVAGAGWTTCSSNGCWRPPRPTAALRNGKDNRSRDGAGRDCGPTDGVLGPLHSVLCRNCPTGAKSTNFLELTTNKRTLQLRPARVTPRVRQWKQNA
jgi:hypothetical protein